MSAPGGQHQLRDQSSGDQSSSNPAQQSDDAKASVAAIEALQQAAQAKIDAGRHPNEIGSTP